MACVETYNIVKEGDLSVRTSVSTFVPTASGLNLLYDGNRTSVAYTIPASGVCSIEASFGDYFEVCSVRYFCSPLVVSDITLTYGLSSGDEHEIQTVSSGTFADFSVNDAVGFLRLTHSGSVSANVQQLEIFSVENATLYFGTVVSGAQSFLFIENSPLSNYSSTVVEVPIYNDESYAVDAKVAVAPTGQQTDNYIYVGLSPTGTFYGINDYGIKQPVFEAVATKSFSFFSENIDDIISFWDLKSTARTYVVPTNSYLRTYITATSVGSHRVAGCMEGFTFALMDKSRFSADQSFTAKLSMRITNFSFPTNYNTPNKLVFGFTNTWPISDSSVFTTEYEDRTFSRFGRSLAAVWVGNHGDTADLYVGSAVQDNEFDSEQTSFRINRTGSNGAPILSYIKLEEISSKSFREAAYLDGTSRALTREVCVSYDHTINTAFFYIDNILLDSFEFSSGSFSESCRFFIGFVGIGTITFDLFSFSVESGIVAKPNCIFSLATAYDSIDPTSQGPDKLIDGVYNETNYTSAWVSALNPQAGDYLDFIFSEVSDVDAVRIRKPAETDLITVSGVAVNTARYSVNSIQMSFDTGAVRYAYFSDPTPSGFDGWDVCYLITTSGTIEPVAQASTVRVLFGEPYDREVGLSVLAIDEFELYTISGTAVPTTSVSGSGMYPWHSGLSVNLAQSGTVNDVKVKYNSLYDVSTVENCGSLIENVDYGVSYPVFGNGLTNDYNYHYAETVFRRRQESNFSECNIYGSSGWVWRFFESKGSFTGVYFEVHSETATGDSFHGKPDKWKIQYLREGGSPTAESDWINIPPISSYKGTGDYRTFTQYLVDHNDGEYYTNFINAYDGLSSIDIPAACLCRRNVTNKVTELSTFSFIASVYIEFDTSYITQAARIVVGDGYNDTGRSVLATGYTFSNIVFYSNRVSGNYLSPVFDMQTKQNTERFFASIDVKGGSSSVIFRSSEEPPEFRYDQDYEEWEDLGVPFAGMDYYNHAPTSVLSLVSVSDSIYIFDSSATKSYIYNTKTRKWSSGFSFPTEVGGSVVYPDSRTVNNAVLVGSTIIVATRSVEGSVSNSSVGKYNLVENSYGISGWELFPYQRQAEAVNASMCSDGNNRAFFLGEEGDMSVLYLTTGELNTEGRQKMPVYGANTRTGFVPVYAGGKIYVFGGLLGFDGPTYLPCPYADVYDVDSDAWSSLTTMPFSVDKSWAIVYDDFIYVMSLVYTVDTYAPYFKYCISTNTWTVVNSLGYNKANYWAFVAYDFVGDTAKANAYCLCGDFIYGYSSTTGNLRRFKVKREPWGSGCLPGKGDPSWYKFSGIPWNEQITVSGELMPQERYIQYRIQLDCDEVAETPVLSSITAVQPQTVSDIPASGTKSFYVKTGIFDNLESNILLTAKLKIYND